MMGVASGESTIVPATASTEPIADKRQQGQQVVRQNALWAMGAGAVPLPFIDVLGITAVQLRMVKQLCAVYGTGFDERAAKHVITSLMASLGSIAVGIGLTGSLLKTVPFVGQALGAVGVSITAGAAVQATGKVLLHHFQGGGTLQSLDTAHLSGYLREEFEKAKASLEELW
jgi:uncharacterized protein (DUF697 family)